MSSDYVYPKCLQYMKSLEEVDMLRLVDSYSINGSVQPNNGSVFSPGMPVNILLPKQDMLDPTTMYLKFQVQMTAPSGTYLTALPATVFINRLETVINGITIETIQSYNQVTNLVKNLSLDAAQQYGISNQCGYNISNTGSPDFFNGHVTTNLNETFSVAYPVQNCFSMCRQLIPLGHMPTTQINFTLESAANVFLFNAVTNTNTFQIKNVELCYELLHVSESMTADILREGRLFLKTTSIYSSTQPLPIGSSGTVSLNFNTSLKSIRAVFITFTPTGSSAQFENGVYDLVDPSQLAGDFSVMIDNRLYPSKPLSLVTGGVPSILQELKKAAAELSPDGYTTVFDKQNSFHFPINNSSYVATNPVTNSEAILSTTSVLVPSLFAVGIHTAKIHNSRMFSGVSASSNAVVVRVNLPIATAYAFNVNCYMVHDGVLGLDLVNNLCTFDH